MILLNQPGEDRKEDQKDDGPKEDRSAFKELNILVIVPLYVHAGRSSEAIGSDSCRSQSLHY